jgi:hypothetical protein
VQRLLTSIHHSRRNHEQDLLISMCYRSTRSADWQEEVGWLWNSCLKYKNWNLEGQQTRWITLLPSTCDGAERTAPLLQPLAQTKTMEFFRRRTPRPPDGLYLGFIAENTSNTWRYSRTHVVQLGELLQHQEELSPTPAEPYSAHTGAIPLNYIFLFT